MNLGSIILINGPSSSGKTTLAKTIQDITDLPMIHCSFDHLRDSGALPMERIKRKDFDWKQMRESVFLGFHRTIEAFARSGNHVIFEHIVESPEWRRDIDKCLKGLFVYWVGLNCPLSELELREQKRGDRRLGEAKHDLERNMYIYCDYDIEVDSTIDPLQSAKELIKDFQSRLELLNSKKAMERIAEALRLQHLSS